RLFLREYAEAKAGRSREAKEIEQAPAPLSSRRDLIKFILVAFRAVHQSRTTNAPAQTIPLQGHRLPPPPPPPGRPLPHLDPDVRGGISHLKKLSPPAPLLSGPPRRRRRRRSQTSRCTSTNNKDPTRVAL